MSLILLKSSQLLINSIFTLTIVLLTASLFQQDLFNPYIVILSFVAAWELLRRQKKSGFLAIDEQGALYGTYIFLLAFIAIACWALSSGYIPWRDNDAFQFWMPKAQNILKYGFMPDLRPKDPSYTLHPSYPPSLLTLSSAFQIFSESFSWKIHRLSLAFVSGALFFMYLNEFVWPYKKDFSKTIKNSIPLLLLILVQSPLWANGYHDVIWVLGWGVLWSMFSRKAKLLELLPLFVLTALAKNEALVFVSLLPLYFSLRNKNFKLLSLLVIPAFWMLVKYVHVWQGELFIQNYPVHSLSEVLSLMGKISWDIAQFKTSHGLAGASLVLGSVYLFKSLQSNYKKLENYFFLIPFLVFVGVYLFSGIDLAWHVQFSWPRLLIFPALVPVFVGLNQKYSEE